MKILSSLVGLLLFIAGIYLTITVFNAFETYETLTLGLYLGGSFVLLTFGTYLFLLPLALKPKNTKADLEPFENSYSAKDTLQSLSSVETQAVLDIKISELDAIKIIQDDSFVSTKNNLSEEALFEEVKPINSNLTITQEIELNTHEEEIIIQDTQDFSQLTPFEVIELRVIGIDRWTSQSILRKLVDNSILELNQKSKSGINMTQVMYKQKLIGYIPRLDMHKINDKLDRLINITPANIVRDGRKIEHFSINLTFKLIEDPHA